MAKHTRPPWAPPWQKVKNAITYFRTVFQGDRFEWQIDLTKAKRPVLLIHGFAMPRQCMAVLENRLTADGYDVFGFRLGPANFLGVEKAARIISIKLRHLIRHHGLGRIAIIGHSLGGIIGRAYITLRKGDRLCHTLITMGSPNQGHPAWKWSRFTPIAWFTHAPRDLHPDSPVMQSLRSHPLPPSVYGVSLFSKMDHIRPASICHFDIPQGALNLVNIHIDGMHHLDFTVDPHAYDIIRDQLEEGFRRAQAQEPDPDETLPVE